MKIAHLLTPSIEDNLTVIYLSRLLFAFIGIGVITCTWYLALFLFYDVDKAFVSVLLLASSSAFLTRGFRIRSDILAALLNLLFILALFRFKSAGINKKNILYGLILSTATTGVLAATPKGIFFYVAQFFLANILLLRIPTQERSSYFKIVSISFSVPIIIGMIMVLLSFIFGEGYLKGIYLKAYFNAFAHFYSLFSEPVIENIKVDRLQFLLRFFKENLLLCTLLIAAFIDNFLSIYRCNKLNNRMTLCFYYVALLILCSFYHHYLPFFIASLVPVGAILAADYIFHVLKLIYHISCRSFISFASICFITVLLFFIFSAFKIGTTSRLYLQRNTNQVQHNTIRYLENYLKDSNSSYYDGIGILPKRSTIFAFVGPNQKYQNKISMSKVLAQKPELIFYTSKLIYLEPAISNFLFNQYVPLGYGAWGRGIRIYLDEEKKLNNISFTTKKDFQIIDARQFFEVAKKRFSGYPLERIYVYNLDSLEDLEPEDNYSYLLTADKQQYPLWGMSLIRDRLVQSKIYLHRSVKKIGISPFSPLKLPNEQDLSIIFSFDYLY